MIRRIIAAAVAAVVCWSGPAMAAWPPGDASASSAEVADALHASVREIATSDPDPSRRAWAWRALAAAHDEDFPSRAATGLADESPDVRREIVAGLRRWIEPEGDSPAATERSLAARNLIAGRLVDADPGVRDAAARTIDERPTPPWARSLPIGAAGDPSRFVREVVWKQLRASGNAIPTGAYEKLAALATTGDPLDRVDALQRLLRESPALPAAGHAGERGATDENALVRRAAIPLIAKDSGDLAARLLADPEPIVRDAAFDLSLYERFRSSSLLGLRSLIASDDPRLEAIAEGLARAGNVSPISIDEWRLLHQDEGTSLDRWTRLTLERLWHESPKRPPFYKRWIETVTDPSDARVAAAWAYAWVATLDEPDRRAWLEGLRAAERGPNSREPAGERSAAFDDRVICVDAVKHFAGSFDHPDPFVRGRALSTVLLACMRLPGRGLSLAECDSFLPQVARGFDDPDPRVRRCTLLAAVESCWPPAGERLSDEASEWLWPRVAAGFDDPDPAVRRDVLVAAVEASSRKDVTGPRHASQTIPPRFFDALKDPDETVRSAVARALVEPRPAVAFRISPSREPLDATLRPLAAAAITAEALAEEARWLERRARGGRLDARRDRVWWDGAVSRAIFEASRTPVPVEHPRRAEWRAATRWAIAHRPVELTVPAAVELLADCREPASLNESRVASDVVLQADALAQVWPRLLTARPDERREIVRRLGAGAWDAADLTEAARFLVELDSSRPELTRALLVTLHDRNDAAAEAKIRDWASDPATPRGLRFAALEMNHLARGDALAPALSGDDPLACMIALNTLRRGAAARVPGPDPATLAPATASLVRGLRRE